MTDDFKPSAKVILDSISPDGHRLTTMEVQLHRYMVPEFNTHRVFSRNAASSRAIPFRKMLEKVRTAKVYPSLWRKEQKGMQGGEIIIDPLKLQLIRAAWDQARNAAARQAELLAELGVHKSIVNRLLEPFLPHTIIVTATSFEGFFDQRCNPQAQDDIRVAAEAMREAYDASSPKGLRYGEWHMPYITPEDMEEANARGFASWEELTETFKKISAARCARVSYLTHDGVRDWEKDLGLFYRLVQAKPGHWSPLEHVATPVVSMLKGATPGNFTGWRQLRHDYELAA